MSRETILWQDFETSGLDPRRDRPIQFAALRTDLELRTVGEPVSLRASLNEDVLPEPDACLVTRQVPGLIPAAGPDVEWLAEWQLAEQLQAVASQAGTCHAGYNSVRFDAEVARFTFWRNLLPVYDHEWRDGNSRWDLLDPMRAARALRPEGLEWPERDGAPAFKLEELTAANGIEHGDAHDALADVRATIDLARRLREAQPRLFDFLLGLRRKAAVLDVLESGRPFVHTSRVYPRELCCTTVVASLGEQPGRRGQHIVHDLRHPPEVLLDHDPEYLRELLYTRRVDRDPDAPQVGLKSVRANRAPVVAPLGVIRDEPDDWTRMEFDPEVLRPRMRFLTQHRAELRRVLRTLYEDRREPNDEVPDADVALYGQFVGDGDAQRLRAARKDWSADTLRGLGSEVDDVRLSELTFRLRCAAFPDELDPRERARWQTHCRERLLESGEEGKPSRVEAILARIAELRGGAEFRGSSEREPAELELLDVLEEFVTTKRDALSATAD